MSCSEKIEFTHLPLAVYREIAAHLRQVTGVEVNLIPQSSPEFDYHQSQIAGLSLNWGDDFCDQSRQRVEEILAYYRDRYSVV